MSGGLPGDLLAQPFMQHALLAGTAIAVLCGLVGYFVVLRGQLFAGDALSHVAFAGALAALAAGIDLRLGLFAATIGVGVVLGLLGGRGTTDDALRHVVDALVPAMLETREAARARKDYAEADRIRGALAASGLVVEDTPDGTRWRVGQAKDHSLARGEGLERLGPEAAECLATVAPRFDQAGGPEAAHVPADERLREADVLDQVRHAGVSEREALDDPQAVDVGEGLVDDAQLAEVFGRVGDGSERGPKSGPGRAQWGCPRARLDQPRFISTVVDPTASENPLSSSRQAATAREVGCEDQSPR